MPPKHNSHIIEVKNIRRSFRSIKKGEGWGGALGLLLRPQYQTHEALKGVSFSIEPGSFNGLIGANGAGKTTLLKILSGLIPATSGVANVLGINPFDRPLDFRRQIALVMGQKAQLWWDLPARDAFDLLRAIYEIPRKTYEDRVDALTNLLDVKHLVQTQIRRLSLGERMKMELIGALLHWPKVIFLDEPTIGLDVLAAYKLREFLKIFNQREKATIILTSHNMEDIEKLCSRVLILKSGELVYDGKPDGLTQDGACQLRVAFVKRPEPAELARLARVPGDQIKIVEGETTESEGEDAATGGAEQAAIFSVKRDQIPSVLQGLMKECAILNMSIEEPSLESVIQRLYQEERSAEVRV